MASDLYHPDQFTWLGNCPSTEWDGAQPPLAAPNREAKVAQLDDALRIEQEVLQLQVAMAHVVRMAVLDRLDELPQDALGVGFFQLLVLLQPASQASPVTADFHTVHCQTCLVNDDLTKLMPVQADHSACQDSRSEVHAFDLFAPECEPKGARKARCSQQHG